MRRVVVTGLGIVSCIGNDSETVTNINETGGLFEKGEIIAELDIKPELWFFDCHFKGDPVMPGCLGLDAMWQLVGFYLGWLGHQVREEHLV